MHNSSPQTPAHDAEEPVLVDKKWPLDTFKNLSRETNLGMQEAENQGRGKVRPMRVQPENKTLAREGSYQSLGNGETVGRILPSLHLQEVVMVSRRCCFAAELRPNLHLEESAK